MLGEAVGSYQIVDKLAEGGMGVVYRARHQLLGKPAAVKVLLPELSSNREIVNRFFNEARAATAVRHPGIVEIFDFGYLPSGMAFIVMELLDGEPLSRRLAAQGRIDERTALHYVRGIASALAAAHAQGIVHRDLKPDNVFLVPDPDVPGGERAKLLDFGIAKVAEAARGAEASTRTRTGAVMGTPTYMSPEQCRGAGDVDHRSDLYSLGCILYEMVAGRPPFHAEGIGEIIGAHLFIAPEPPSRVVSGVSAQVEGLIMNLLAKRPEDRIQSAAELARMLGQGSIPAMSGPIDIPTVMLTPVPQTGTHPGATTANQTVTPTTLSGAAAEQANRSQTVAGAKQRSRGPVIALVALALAGGGVAAVVMSGGGGGSSPSPAAKPEVAPQDPVADPEPPATPDPASPPVAAPDAGVAAAAPPDAAVEVVQATDGGAEPGSDAAASAKKGKTKGKGKGKGKKDREGTSKGTDRNGSTSSTGSSTGAGGAGTGVDAGRVDRGD